LDPAKLRSTIRGALKELSISYDVPEALPETVQKLRDLRIPQEHQAGEFAHILLQTAEQGNSSKRNVMFRFAAQLFLDGVLARSELREGLEKLCKSYEDLKVDVPRLPDIMRKECLPAIEELVKAGFLTAEQLEVFARHFDD
jgi:hypothetical protein